MLSWKLGLSSHPVTLKHGTCSTHLPSTSSKNLKSKFILMFHHKATPTWANHVSQLILYYCSTEGWCCALEMWNISVNITLSELYFAQFGDASGTPRWEMAPEKICLHLMGWEPLIVRAQTLQTFAISYKRSPTWEWFQGLSNKPNIWRWQEHKKCPCRWDQHTQLAQPTAPALELLLHKKIQKALCRWKLQHNCQEKNILSPSMSLTP